METVTAPKKEAITPEEEFVTAVAMRALLARIPNEEQVLLGVEQAPDTVEDQVTALLNDSSPTELRSDITSYGFDYERYDNLLQQDNPREDLLNFAAGLEAYTVKNTDVVSQLRSAYYCLDITQAAVRASENYGVGALSALNTADLPAIHSAYRKALDSSQSAPAIVGLVTEKIRHVFSYYPEHPTLHIDTTYRDYETDILGGYIKLSTEGLPDSITGYNNNTYPDAELNAPQTNKQLSAHPVRLAEGLIGFRDTNERITLVAEVDQADLDAAVPYDYERYAKLDHGMKDYLSGTDYDLILDHAKRGITVNNTQSFNKIKGIRPGQIELFQELHRPLTREIIESALGVDLGSIKIEYQMMLLDYMSTRNASEATRLSAALQSVDPTDRMQMFESFMALDQGEDYAEILLDIAENIKGKELTELLTEFNELRNTAKNLSELFPSSVSSQVKAAALETMSELLEVAREVALHGPVSQNLLSTFYIEAKSVSEVIKDYRTLNDTLKALLLTVKQGNARALTHAGENFKITEYSPTSENGKYVQEYTRQFGARRYDSGREFGRPHEGVEASIGYTTTPDGNNRMTPIKKDREDNSLSVRLDREGLDPNTPRNEQTRNPVNETGTISLDIGSLTGVASSFGTRIGRLIALGNSLRSTRLQTNPSLNHNSSKFDQETYGTASGFASLVKETRSAIASPQT